MIPCVFGRVELKSYQEAALAAFLEFLAQHRMQLAFLPTGTGKTVLGLALALALMRLVRAGKKLPGTRGTGRVLWLVHRKELVTQPITKLRDPASAMAPEADVGIVRANHNHYWAKDIVFATVQSLSRTHRLEQVLSGGDFDLVVVDEAHHALAATYQKILTHPRLATTPVLGLTATPIGTEGKGLHDAGFTAFCMRMSIADAIRYGHLVDFDAHRVVIPKFDESKLRTQNGDYVESELAKALEDAHAAEHSAAAWAERAGERRGVIFTASVKLAQDTAKELQKRGIPAGWVAGTMDEEERDRVLKDHQAGRIRVVANHSVLTEGYDDPAMSCCMMARLTKSKKVYVQCVGRVLRLHAPGKRALILDLVGAHENVGLVIAPRLKHDKEAPAEEGLDTLAQYTGAGDDVVVDLDAEVKAEAESTERELVSRFLAAASSGTATVSTSRLRWITCSEGLFAIPLGEEGHLVLREASGGWVALRAPERGPREILVGPSSDAALVQSQAERYAKEIGALTLSAKDALWRSREATDAQLSLLAGLRSFHVEGLTAGEASDLITAAKVRRAFLVAT